ncbi:hypothetical protein H2200_012728 [Cladophialophora chaetospira]|uniref:Mucin n=1 Tax=Cladophialophora chaetospira TaxID=386627 RepID=A0AA38WXH5_9EURO|nr:hypothetical protein H2200_012728 [Cladophialophora chaetospira]
MSTVHQAVEPFDWANPGVTAAYKDTATYGCKRWNNTNYFSTGLPTPPGPKAMPGVALGNSYTGYAVPAYQQPRSNLADSTHPQQFTNSSATNTSNTYALAPPTNGTSLYNRGATSHNDSDLIAPHLQIPESVNKSKGSLAEFAAEITSLFWFETSSTLQYAENLAEDAPVNRALLPDALPSVGFRKWVTTIISTTQVGKNVILLALMFIYRLKRFNPSVSGKRGSEFRLLTIALMLGNKFLDDNTYTNKTWAEVSGISVTEIHIMEVEFLSNMRYDLYASAEEWSQWKAKLGRFGAFYQKASQLPYLNEARTNGSAPVTPTAPNFPHKLPSPPSTHHSMNPYSNSTASTNHYPVLPHPSASVPPPPNSPLRQQVDAKGYQQERKRSADDSAELPPAKRQLFTGQVSGNTNHVPPSLPYARNNFRVSPTRSTGIPDLGASSTSLDIPRLDIPRLSASIPPPSGHPTPLSAHPTRAMSGVYPAATSSYSHPVTPISAIPQNIFQNPIPSLGEQRSISNYPSTHTSPSNGYNTTPTLPGLSPSYFLTHRTSPYRPVRHVNTLLIPPPATALQAPVRNIPSNQIHYQPLSKVDTERRTGPLPFFQSDSWQNSAASTPLAQQQYQF